MASRKASKLKPKVEKQCSICKTIFFTAYLHQKTCSAECRKESHKVYNQIDYKENREIRLRNSKIHNKNRRILNPDIEKNARYKYVYGISLVDFRLMVKLQNNKCFICSFEFSSTSHRTKPHLDHDHSSGLIRKVLCDDCNNLLGRANDDPKILKSAIKYLEKYSR